MGLFAHTAVGFVAALLGAQDAGLLVVPCPARERLESGRRVAQRVSEILARSRARALVDVAMAGPDAELAAAVAESGATLLGSVGSAAVVQASTLPLTSSGKVMRPEARRLRMEGLS